MILCADYGNLTHRCRSVNGGRHARFRAVREMMLAVRATVVAAYYDQPEVHFALGYHPKPWIRKRLALRRRLMAGRHATRDDLIPFAPPAVSS